MSLALGRGQKGDATFGADGRYSFEVTPSTGNQQGIRASGTYTLDEAGKALTLNGRREFHPKLERDHADRFREVRFRRSPGMDNGSAAHGLG